LLASLLLLAYSLADVSAFPAVLNGADSKMLMAETVLTPTPCGFLWEFAKISSE
jgi:hypothetical protein